MMSRIAADNASRTLKVVGVILLLLFLVDAVFLAISARLTELPSRIRLATALVDRGVVPLVGLGSLFAAYWIDTTEDGSGSLGLDLRLPALILSSLLGLVFLLVAPMHLMNMNQLKNEQVETISQQAQQAENNLQGQLNQFQQLQNNEQFKAELQKRREGLKAQLNEVLKDEKRYKQALESPQTPPEFKDILKKAKANPQQLDKLIEDQTNPQLVADKQRNRIREERERVEKQTQQQAFSDGVKTGVSSLLLSIAYIVIGWGGLRSMGSMQGSPKKAPAR